MFRTWLQQNRVSDFDYTGVVYEPAKNRDFWQRFAKPEYIENAENYLRYEWPLIRATDYIAFQKEGNRVIQEKPHFKKRTALIALLIGEICEYKGRFLPDITDGVFSICEESFWGLSAHIRPALLPNVKDHYIDLFAAETGALIVLVLHLLKDELTTFCPELVERMTYELEERIVKAYLNHTDFWWMGYTGRVNNWNPWVLSNVLTVFLLTQQQETLHRGIEKMLYEIQGIYDNYGDDGGCDEGISYWGVSGGTIYEFCEQLYRATNGRISFFDDEKIKNIADYPCKTYIGGRYFVNFADGSSMGSPTWKSLFYGFGKRTGNRNLVALAGVNLGATNSSLASMRTTYTKRVLENVICADLPSETLTPFSEAVLPDVQNAFARADNWYYAAKGGHNEESHNHNDVGSFIAYYNNTPVLVDPSCGVYTKQTFSEKRYELWTMQSAWHNLPTVNGKQQKYGGAYTASRFAFADKVCEIDFEKAYEDAALSSLKRRIAFLENGVCLTDTAAFTAPCNTLEEHFITPLDVEIRENGAIIGGKFVLTADVKATVTADKQDFLGDEKLRHSWGVEAMNRLTFRFECGEQATVTFRLETL